MMASENDLDTDSLEDVPLATVSPARYRKSKEEARKDAEESFSRTHSFRPAISTAPGTGSKRQPSAVAQAPFYKRVEEMQRRYQEKLVQREHQRFAAQEEELQKECTFTPKINRTTNLILKDKARQINDLNMGRSAYVTSSSSSSEGASSKRATDESRVGFAPLPQRNVPDVAERLHAEATIRAQQKHWLERTVQQAREQQYPFRPFINPATAAISESLDYQPIHERVGDLQKQHSERLHQLQKNVEDSYVDLTFAPKIDEKSRRLAEARTQAMAGSEGMTLSEYIERSEAAVDEDHIISTGIDASFELGLQQDVISRLQFEGRLMERRKQIAVQEWEHIEAATMVPAGVSVGTDKIAKESEFVSAPFEQRQEVYKLKASHKAHERVKEDEAKAALLFKPAITNESKAILYEKRPECLIETLDEKVHRMSNRALEEIESKRKAKEHEVYGNYSYSPQIDPISQKLAKPSDIEELVANRRGERVRFLARRKAAERETAECTFRPKINDYPLPADPARLEEMDYRQAHGVLGWQQVNPCPVDAWAENDGLRQSADLSLNSVGTFFMPKPTLNLREPEKMAREIRLKLEEKEERRRSELMAREIEELKECTFQPRIPGREGDVGRSVDTQASKKSQAPVVIRGLGRHLELKHLQAKKDEEKKQREQDAFRVKNARKYKRAGDGTTIVKPFSFSRYRGEGRMSRAVIENIQQQDENLTFEPNVSPAVPAYTQAASSSATATGKSSSRIPSNAKYGSNFSSGSYLKASQRVQQSVPTTSAAQKGQRVAFQSIAHTSGGASALRSSHTTRSTRSSSSAKSGVGTSSSSHNNSKITHSRNPAHGSASNHAPSSSRKSASALTGSRDENIGFVGSDYQQHEGYPGTSSTEHDIMSGGAVGPYSKLDEYLRLYGDARYEDAFNTGSYLPSDAYTGVDSNSHVYSSEFARKYGLEDYTSAIEDDIRESFSRCQRLQPPP